jgi:hypothetical protein
MDWLDLPSRYLDKIVKVRPTVFLKSKNSVLEIQKETVFLKSTKKTYVWHRKKKCSTLQLLSFLVKTRVRKRRTFNVYSLKKMRCVWPSTKYNIFLKMLYFENKISLFIYSNFILLFFITPTPSNPHPCTLDLSFNGFYRKIYQRLILGWTGTNMQTIDKNQDILYFVLWEHDQKTYYTRLLFLVIRTFCTSSSENTTRRHTILDYCF